MGARSMRFYPRRMKGIEGGVHLVELEGFIIHQKKGGYTLPRMRVTRMCEVIILPNLVSYFLVLTSRFDILPSRHELEERRQSRAKKERERELPVYQHDIKTFITNTVHKISCKSKYIY